MIRVACAIIEDGGKVLAAQRSETMKHPLKWEFPGGKIGVGEREEEALIREILEELNVEVEITGRLEPRTFSYGTHEVSLIPFICRVNKGEMRLTEHKAAQFFPAGEIETLDWLEADVAIVNDYLRMKNAR